MSASFYEYGPFGEPIRVSGTMAGQNPFRFSTKQTDNFTGHIDYGHRDYIPLLGRWANMDPIAERGGSNLYGFVNNYPVNDIDIFGLRTCAEQTNWQRIDGQWAIVGIALDRFTTTTVQYGVLDSFTLRYGVRTKTHCCCANGQESAWGTMIKDVVISVPGGMEGVIPGAIPATAPLAAAAANAFGALLSALASASTSPISTLPGQNIAPTNTHDIWVITNLAITHPKPDGLDGAKWQFNPCNSL